MKTVLDLDELVFGPPEPDCLLALPGLPGSGSKLYDRSSYGHLGTITGATWQRAPSGLWCLSYDGVDDFTNCGNAPSLQIQNTITVEAWVKQNTLGRRLMGKMNSGATAGWALYFDGAGKLGVWIGGLSALVSDVVLALGTFGHVAFTYDKPNGILCNYVDSVLKRQTGVTGGTLLNTTDNLDLGRYNAGGFAYFSGVIALVRIYNRALNALEINNHFHREKYFFGVWSR